MSKELIILFSAWALMMLMLVIWVPKNKIRQAFVIFFFKQFLTWMFGLLVVEYRLIEYPVRLIQYASRSSFTFEYFVYPSICVVFNLYYPFRKRFIGRFMHYVYYCTAITAIEALLEIYTDLIKYIHWSWYLTWITLFLTFLASHKFYVWFYKIDKQS